MNESKNGSVHKSALLRNHAYIDDQWCDADSGRLITVLNPANGMVIGSVPMMGQAETRRAIVAANDALPAWRARTALDRASYLQRWHSLMCEHRGELSMLMTLEQGKPLAEAGAEIDYAAAYVRWYAEEARRIYGDVIPSESPDRRIAVLRQPIGVCAAITPWNFPAAMITRKVAPALAAGCTIVVKPASATPLTALALAYLAQRAGIPPGVLNVVTGGASAIGTELATNPLVRKLSFTGSTEIGRVLLAQCASTIKKTSMELGGNAPFIVFDDADIEEAVAGAIAAKFRNGGQACVAANRIYVHSGIYEAFASALTESVKRLKVGNGLDADVQVGPLIDEAAVSKVQDLLADARQKGAVTLTGGTGHRLGGTYFEPTVVVDADESMRFSTEETFGPIAALFKFETEEQVLKAANSTEYGLAAYVYTQNLSRSWRVSEALEYGIIGVNTGLISTAVAPFGGIKQSGLGREGSRYGIDDYLELKYVALQI